MRTSGRCATTAATASTAATTAATSTSTSNSPHRLLPLQDNHKAFEAENCAAIKTLVALLVPESDSQTLAVACHDIGEFVKHHPEGRRLMTQFGAKLAVRWRSSNHT